MKKPIQKDMWTEWLYFRRNKSYGSFVERKRIPKREFLGLLISVITLILLYGSPLLIYKYRYSIDKDAIKVEQMTVVSYSQLMQPPPIEMIPQQQPILELPPEVSTVKFVKPEVKKDEEVKEESYIPTQEEFQKANPGTETSKSIDSVIIDQQKATPKVETDDNTVFTLVEVKPEFPGGRAALMKYLAENIRYPRLARELNIQGTVIIQFTVDRNGMIRDVAVARGIGGGCDEEAVRVVENMPPWTPGRQNDRPVNVRYSLPIRFELREY
ncbi:MAG: TonB family protein [Thermaurantimonas sp.]